MKDFRVKQLVIIAPFCSISGSVSKMMSLLCLQKRFCLQHAVCFCESFIFLLKPITVWNIEVLILHDRIMKHWEQAPLQWFFPYRKLAVKIWKWNSFYLYFIKYNHPNNLMSRYVTSSIIFKKQLWWIVYFFTMLLINSSNNDWLIFIYISKYKISDENL